MYVPYHIYGFVSKYNKFTHFFLDTWSVPTVSLLIFQTGLSDSDLKSLDDVYTGTYLAKYPIVGYMDYLLEGENLEGLKMSEKEL